ncbi:MAG: tyrosine-type recombinase/integrase, partial [Acidobacteriota bacterium]
IRQGRNPELREMPTFTFSDHAREVIEKHYANKRSGWWAKLNIEKHMILFFGDMLLGAITPEKIVNYRTRRLGQGVAHGTVNNERAILSKVFTLAIDWERLSYNPVKKVGKLEQPAGRLRYLERPEADSLIGASPAHIRPVIIIALETGGRLSEVLGLKLDDLDFHRSILYFDQTNTKSGRQREIPMTPMLVDTMHVMLKVRPLARTLKHVFIRHGKPMRDVRTAFTKARQRAGLGKDVTFHTLRHTFASWYVMDGGDLYRLQKLLGHATIAQTQKYAHLAPEYMKSAVQHMGLRHKTATIPRTREASAS